MEFTLLILLSCLGLLDAELRVFNLRASGLPSDILGITDGYVKVFSGSEYLGSTSVRENNADPWWEEEFVSFWAKEHHLLRLEVHDDDFLFDDLLGICQLEIVVGTHHRECYLEKAGILYYSYTFDEQ